MRFRYGFSLVGLSACLFLGIVAGAPLHAQANESFAPLVEKMSPAVVNVSTTQTLELSGSPLNELFSQEFPPGHPLSGLPDLFERFYGLQDGEKGEKRKTTSLGSGFVVSPEGYIVTNYHVIEKSEEIMVTFHDDVQMKAKIVGTDEKTDIALLKVDAKKPLPYATWGKSDAAKVGDWVIAIGNPFGLGGSVSAGIISARARDINSGPFDDYIQTDAAINRGNSGGPLFNADGEVIGVNTAIFSPSGGNVGIGFAVPATLAEPVVRQLKEYGKTKRGWLGVKIQQVTDEIAGSLGMEKSRGALIIEVNPGSPADKAGIKTGDVILSFDGVEVAEMRRLPRMVAEATLNEKADVEIWRNEQTKTLSVVIAEMTEDQEKSTKTAASSFLSDKPGESSDVLGMRVAPIGKEARERYGLAKDAKGLLVASVENGSAAQDQGVRAGDVIISANQKDVAEIKDLRDAVAESKKSGRPALLMVQRAGSAIFIAVPAK
ncbi:MAG: DegQ family serine endoprotease [Rickettsiales bacterium]